MLRRFPTTTAGIAYASYAVIGVFAAARYGLRTEGDVLVNRWLPGRWDGVLSAAMTLCELGAGVWLVGLRQLGAPRGSSAADAFRACCGAGWQA